MPASNRLPRGSSRTRLAVGVGTAVALATCVSSVDAPVPARATTLAGAAASHAGESAAQERAAALVARMTLDEKLVMVHGGTLQRGAGAGSIPGNARLGIPALNLSDSPLGVGNFARGVTQFPIAANNAATWDQALVNEFGTALGGEFWGKGRNVALGPTVDIVRTPLWGRAFETFGEDPLLNARMGVAAIDGIQSQDVMATVKHFALNNQETDRHDVDVQVDERTAHELYYLPYEAAVRDADVGAVMCSYNKVNGTHACESPEMLTTALRDMWEFAGVVISDWDATHSTAESANAGLDVEMPGDAAGNSHFGTALRQAVESGEVPMARLDQMVGNLLTAMIANGLFERPAPDAVAATDTVVSTPENRDLAGRLSQEGTVLLKNDSVLPLTDDAAGSIAVIGYAADAGATYTGGGSAAVQPSETPVSPLRGITERAAGEVRYESGPGAPLPVLSEGLVPVSGEGSGLTGTYYATGDFTGEPLAVRTDTALDFGVRRVGQYGLPVPGAFSVRWEATMPVTASGTYNFDLSILGNARLFVNGEQVIDAGGGSQGTTGQGSVELVAGQDATIKLEYVPFSRPTFGVLYGHMRFGARTPVDPDPITAAAIAAAEADVAVVFANDATSEAMDRSTLSLPGEQDALISAVAAVNPRTVVVLNTGSAVTMPWLDDVDAVLEAWYPGQRYGSAIASLLFGDVNPSGKLPLTFPVSDDQGPWAAGPEQFPGVGGDVTYSEGLDVGYRWYDTHQEQPLFPFGHGLSYTDFELSRLKVAPKVTDGRRPFTVQFLVKNTGTVAGAEVPQVYLTLPDSAAAPMRLVGFEKVFLQPGETERVTMTVDPTASNHPLSVWDTASDGWITPTGDYTVALARSAADAEISKQVRVKSSPRAAVPATPAPSAGR